MKRNKEPLSRSSKGLLFVMFLGVAAMLGLWIGFGFTLFRPIEKASEPVKTFMVSDNGYSGSSLQAPLAPVTTNEKLEQAAENARLSVVTILTVVTQTSPFGIQEGNALGSGVVYRMDKDYVYVITNAHVVEGATEISLFFDYDNIVDCELQGADKEQDLCVLKVASASIPKDAYKDMKEVTWADSDKVRVGDTCMAVGCPYGLEYANSASLGIVSGTQREITYNGMTLSVMQTDAAINPGNSGGAMVNEEGELIGINSAKMQMAEVEGMGFFIPSNTVKPIVEKLLSEGTIEHPSLGIASFDFISEAMAEIYDVPVGLIVYDAGRGAAASAGLRAGDIITHIDGKAITALSDVDEILDQHEIGDTVTLTVFRERGENGTFDISLKLASLESQEEHKGSFFEDRQ